MSNRNTPLMQEDLRRVYTQALDALLVKVKQDRYIVAAILYGSLAYDDIWEKSDIDIMLLTRDDKTTNRFYTLVEQGISIHVDIGPRSDFKALIERSLQGSRMLEQFRYSLVSDNILTGHGT